METNGFDMGFEGRGKFGFGGKNNFFDRWSKLTTEEKVIYIDERMEAMEGMHNEHPFCVEFIDKFCSEWVNKTSEEKEEFIQKKKETFGKYGFHGHGFEFDEDSE